MPITTRNAHLGVGFHLVRRGAQGHQVQQRHDGSRASTCWGTGCVREEARQSSAEPASPVSKGPGCSVSEGWPWQGVGWDYVSMGLPWGRGRRWGLCGLKGRTGGSQFQAHEVAMSAHSWRCVWRWTAPGGSPLVEHGNLIKSGLDDS